MWKRCKIYYCILHRFCFVDKIEIYKLTKVDYNKTTSWKQMTKDYGQQE